MSRSARVASNALRACRTSFAAERRVTLRRLYSTSNSQKPLIGKAISFQSPRGSSLIPLLAGGGILSLVFASQFTHDLPDASEKSKAVQDDEVVEDAETRYLRLNEIKQHDGNSPNPWITRGDSVYDITDWVASHPGGEVILRAAGGSVDPYWDIFSIHKKQDVYDILEQYFIGKIHPRDLVDGRPPAEAIEDPFSDDPARNPSLRTLSSRPCNAETPQDGLSEYLTPTDLFYVRNHMWVPKVEEPEHQLTVELMDGEEKVYTMKDLKEKFKHFKITSTLQCSGNRRKHMSDEAKRTNGLPWTTGAISNAEWEGVKLSDVLKDAGFSLDDPPKDAKHIQFTGLEAYGASIPIANCLDPRGDVLLAFKMNGKDIPRDHGYPIRVLVPGTVAARSVKWLRKIVISDEESPSQWQRRDYKLFGPNIGANPDWSSARSIQEMPVNSAITKVSQPPLTGNTGHQHGVSLEGYAYSGGGREIIRVDISLDNGKTWDQAELLENKAKGSKVWTWKRWRYQGPLPTEPTTFLVKAVDEAYNTQPESHLPIYNVRGNLANAWHRYEYRPQMQ